MKKRILGLMMVGILAAATPAMAQFGTADPRGLFSVGAVVPFFGATGNQAYLEIESPVGDNGSSSGNPVHVRFFKDDCSAQTSINIPMSPNDVAFLTLSDSHGGLAVYNGLAVIAGSADGLTLIPLSNALHAISHWVNISEDYARTVDPISVVNYEGPATTTWNNLRTAAQFYAPLDDVSVQTTIVFICPSTAITGTGSTGGVIQGAPIIDIITARSTGSSDTNAVLRGVVYDDDELSLRDITTTCNCVTIRRVTELEATVYIDPVLAANGTYTEIRGGEPLIAQRSFTGYRAMRVLGSLTIDDWGRLLNGSSNAIMGNGAPNGR
jgi:hypothetical protein